MIVTITNLKNEPMFVSLLYLMIPPFGSVRCLRSRTEVELDQGLKLGITAGRISVLLQEESVDFDVIVTGSLGGGGGGTFTESDYSCLASVVVNDIVYMSAPGAVAKADASSTTTSPAIGIVSAKPTPTTATVRTDGLITGMPGLVAGDIYYLASGLPGTMTTIAPSVAPGRVQKLGQAKTTSSFEINIDSDFVDL